MRRERKSVVTAASSRDNSTTVVKAAGIKRIESSGRVI
jgi:hypothetical protein